MSQNAKSLVIDFRFEFQVSEFSSSDVEAIIAFNTAIRKAAEKAVREKAEELLSAGAETVVSQGIHWK